ncbi:hypothetical protein K474DRAFT_408826 [Panus rudis PR-1116 ss-1]|nr:hypothetical protein K474DRAFT_408826 [Panus rudis PR-1116 ss-1]
MVQGENTTSCNTPKSDIIAHSRRCPLRRNMDYKRGTVTYLPVVWHRQRYVSRKGWSLPSHNSWPNFPILLGQIPSNVSVEEECSRCSLLRTFWYLRTRLGVWRCRSHCSVSEGGRGKYAGGSILILGGSSSVGQYRAGRVICYLLHNGD